MKKILSTILSVFIFATLFFPCSIYASNVGVGFVDRLPVVPDNMLEYHGDTVHARSYIEENHYLESYVTNHTIFVK